MRILSGMEGRQRACASRLGLLSLATLLGFYLLCAGCDRERSSSSKETLRVFVADSLARPMAEAKRAFEQENPNIEVVQIPSGSVLAIRKITEGGDLADLLAVADCVAIDELMRPRYADWCLVFATNEVVIAHTPASRGASGLTAANWFDVLSREDVRVGAANPYHDPCGYWTMLCWQLADRYYAEPLARISERMERKCGPAQDRRSDSEELISLLEAAGGIDYAFVYRSQALQHRLSFLRLPAEINLGDVAQRDKYREVSVALPARGSGSEIRKNGEAILYAATIPKNARQPDLAAQYLQFVLSPKGRAILNDQYLAMMDVPWTNDRENVPAPLRELLEARPASTRPGGGSEHSLSGPTGSKPAGGTHGR